MGIISYSQNREDVLLDRLFPGSVGFYVDIGAADPVELSVTKVFYDRGWSGINVEPQHQYYHKLVADRPRDTTLQLLISDQASNVEFTEFPTHPGWASADPETMKRLQDEGIIGTTRIVPAITFTQLCDTYVGERTIDFLKIDVEGYEHAVLAGGDFRRFRPRVILVEATEVGKPDLNHDRWEHYLLTANYHFALFDGLNRFYVRSEDHELLPKLQVPANIHDCYQPYEWLKLWQDAERRAQELVHARAEVTDLRNRLYLCEQELAKAKVELIRLEKSLSNSASSAAYHAANEFLDAARRTLARVQKVNNSNTKGSIP